MGSISHKFMTYKHMNSQPQQSATSLNLLSFRRRSEKRQNTEKKTSAFCPNSRSPHWEYLLPTLFLRNQLFPHGNSTFFLPASIALARNNATHRKTLASTLNIFTHGLRDRFPSHRPIHCIQRGKRFSFGRENLLWISGDFSLFRSRRAQHWINKRERRGCRTEDERKIEKKIPSDKSY